MKILVVNTGSSSLKFELIEVTSCNKRSIKKLASGSIRKIRSEFSIEGEIFAGIVFGKHLATKNYQDAAVAAVKCIKSICAEKPDWQIDAIGHRVVHGGGKFHSPTMIDSTVLHELEKLNELAPLHNPIALEAIQLTKEIFDENVPTVAVFDTAFHQTIPTHAATYALPHELTERHNIRRYGFHGIAHESMLRRYCELTGKAISETNIIMIQLGSGCSITAIRNGKSVDTSMGFTPLEGLVMATRSGDIDPGLLGYLAQKEKLSIAELERILNEESGLLGISGRSPDVRDLLAAEKSDLQSALALNLFCYRVRKYIGSYLAVLNGTDAIVFGGGVGEHHPIIRKKILEEMDWCGIRLNLTANADAIGVDSCISEPESSVALWMIPVDEAALIACRVVETVGCNPKT